MYKTIKGQSFSEFVEKKSRFISYGSHVTYEEEAINFIKSIKDKHMSVTHTVYAYILKKNQIQKYSDDGEPRGTAGIPVMNVLVRAQLFDIVVVVTRYFGGILLGASGLVRAYSKGCKLVVENAKIISIHDCRKLLLNFNYTFYQRVKAILSNYHHKIINTVYKDNIIVEAIIRQSSCEKLVEDILSSTSGQVSIKILNSLETSLD